MRIEGRRTDAAASWRRHTRAQSYGCVSTFAWLSERCAAELKAAHDATGLHTCGQELRRHAAHLRGNGGGGRARVSHVRAALVALNGLKAAHAGQRSLPVVGRGAREAQALVARLGQHHVQRAARQRLERCAAQGRAGRVE